MLETTDQGRLRVIRLAHGKASALDIELCEALSSALDAAGDDDTCGAVVLTGRGKIFSAGVDLPKLLDGGQSYVERFVPLLCRLFSLAFTLPKPLIAAVNGHAIAGGCIIACTADYRLMATNGGRIGVSELRVGVPFPAAALETLRFAVPPPHFQQMVYTGRSFSAEEALAIGMVDELVDGRELEQRAAALAEDFLTIPPATFRLTKRQTRARTLREIDALDASFGEEVMQSWKSAEVRSAVERFVEKTLRRR